MKTDKNIAKDNKDITLPGIALLGTIKALHPKSSRIRMFCTYGGWWAMALSGGLNYQIEHHAFPRLSSWHYPTVQMAVMQCCREHHVAYTYYPSLWTNLRATWRYMRRVGVAQVLREAHED